MGPTRRPDFTTGGVSAQSDDTVSIRFRLCNYRIALKTPVCVGVLRELFRPCFAPTLEKPVEDTITLGVGPEDHPVRLGSNASECSRPRRGDQITAEDVRYWHRADVAGLPINVRLRGKADITNPQRYVRQRPQSGHWRRLPDFFRFLICDCEGGEDDCDLYRPIGGMLSSCVAL